jgi:hypothetical protein
MALPKLKIPKSKFIEDLKKRIQKGNDIDKYIQSNQSAIEKIRRNTKLWDDMNKDFLESSFIIYPNIITQSYQSNNDLDLIVPGLNINSWYFQSFIHDKIYVLEGIIERTEFMEEVKSIPTVKINEMLNETENNKVFIVHGHDNIRDQIARILTKLGLDPIILQEQTNGGRTIIENFEEHSSSVGFAIVLLTGDDLGRGKNETDLKKRARQNVILELGYFMGRLSRKKVMTLISDDVEIPSDIDGLLYCKIDDAGAWKLQLARELKGAGFLIDLNKLH